MIGSWLNFRKGHSSFSVKDELEGCELIFAKNKTKQQTDQRLLEATVYAFLLCSSQTPVLSSLLSQETLLCLFKPYPQTLPANVKIKSGSYFLKGRGALPSKGELMVAWTMVVAVGMQSFFQSESPSANLLFFCLSLTASQLYCSFLMM